MSQPAIRQDPALQALLARLAGLRLDAHGLVEGLLSGHHRSPHHGVSVEFAEHREYSPGDELRTIDWKAYGRTDKLHVKRFHHETDLTARIVVDASGSMAYGPESTMKYRAAAVLALAVSYILLRQGDRVELVCASDRVVGRVPPRPGLGHFQALADLLEGTPPQGGTELGEVLTAGIESLGRRRVVILLSDAFEEPETLFFPIRALRARQCAVLLVQVMHGDELDLPFEGVREFLSLEAPGSLVAEPQLIRAIYLKRLAEHMEKVTYEAKHAHIGHLLLRSDEPLDAPLFELVREGIP